MASPIQSRSAVLCLRGVSLVPHALVLRGPMAVACAFISAHPYCITVDSVTRTLWHGMLFILLRAPPAATIRPYSKLCPSSTLYVFTWLLPRCYAHVLSSRRHGSYQLVNGASPAHIAANAGLDVCNFFAAFIALSYPQSYPNLRCLDHFLSQGKSG
jgi:hypothetical protein